jgi:4-alpha-glucanotransferase
MTFHRASGILLHPTSLPGRFGIGDLGEQAYRFADFLVASGQSLWQVLPLGPTGLGGSPYACYSAFAGNTLLISPEKLFEDGLLARSDLDQIPSLSAGRVDFEKVHKAKDFILNRAFAIYRGTSDTKIRSAFEDFTAQNAAWLDEYALFRALKDVHGGSSWHEWEPLLVARERPALARAREQLRDQIEAQKFFQFLFFKQWFALKAYCNERNISLIGDIPMFVALDSADVWTNPDQFKLDAELRPTVVAGVPPDYFSATGQFWGNPIYEWDAMRADGFAWWIERVRASLTMADIARIDHFRGFAACWEIPGGDTSAERGRWVDAPGRELFAAVRKALGELPIIAEDLGVITADVDKLRDECGFPGMRVLQFGFSGDMENINLPHNYARNVVAYTGTHDNDTAAGWFNGVAGSDSTRTGEQTVTEKEFCMKYLNSTGAEIHWDFIRAVLQSAADTAVTPLQDVLGIGPEGRMNVPNTSEGNWTWRFQADALTELHSERLRTMTEESGRIKG